MKKTSLVLDLKKAPFSAIMTIISLVFFVVIYALLTLTVVEPHYFRALIFAVPFVLYGTITLLTVKNIIKENASILSTGILIIPLAIAMLFALLYISFDCGMTSTTDVGRYERALRLSKFPDKLSEIFPNKIPENAKNISFNYNKAFGQGGHEMVLKFETDPDSVKRYIVEFSNKAKWIGKVNESEAGKYGVNDNQFRLFEYTNSGLPKDYVVYVIFSEPYKLGDWNHGKVSLVAINEQNNQVIFLAEEW